MKNLTTIRNEVIYEAFAWKTLLVLGTNRTEEIYKQVERQMQNKIICKLINNAILIN